MEAQLQTQIAHMDQVERITMLGKLIPEFEEGIFEMRRTGLKYNTLTKRLSANVQSSAPTQLAVIGEKIKEQLLNDTFAKQIGIADDIVTIKLFGFLP